MRKTCAGTFAVLILAMVPGHASAQYGFGWGMFGWQPSPATNYVNDRALVGQSRVVHPEPLRAPGAGQSFRGRDPEFFERYDIQTRRAMEDRVARRPSRPTAAQTAATTAPTSAGRPVAALASFFNKSEDLIWPSEAPVEGDLLDKRTSSDQASLDALREQRSQGTARIGTVTQARHLLLEYGRPALAQLRTMSTAPVADSFHRFLLSLYDALAQAGPKG